MSTGNPDGLPKSLSLAHYRLREQFERYKWAFGLEPNTFGIRVMQLLEMYEDVAGFYSLDVCFVGGRKAHPKMLPKRRGLNSALARSILKNVSGIIQLVDKSLHENHKLSPCTSTRVIVSFLSKPKGSKCRHNASISRKGLSTS